MLIDLLVYSGMIAFGSSTAPAKAIGFIVGAAFSYHANRHLTFRAERRGTHVAALFGMVYLTSLLLNVAVDAAALDILAFLSPWRIPLAWFVATACSATLNFTGMKFLVFHKRAL